MLWSSVPGRSLRGTIRVPGDKSIAHRALILAALAEGRSDLSNLPAGQDVAATADCLCRLGCQVRIDGDRASVTGVGLGGLRASETPLDCGNSGTAMRLLGGVAAGQPFETVLDGDASLRGRPMERIAVPLRRMGAEVETSSGCAPIRVRGGSLAGVEYTSPVSSAQVKSAVLLAGLFADGPTTVFEPTKSRDHTECMLAASGVEIGAVGAAGVRLTAVAALTPLSGSVPGDLSSAAYWIVAALLSRDAEVEVTEVGLNPTRSAFLDVLNDWGAGLEASTSAAWCGEPLGDIRVRSARSRLRGGAIGADQVPGVIDELPLLGLVAPLTERGMTLSGAAELRAKESDRIATTLAAVRALGGEAEETEDGWRIPGRQDLSGGTVAAAGDHRIALAAAAVACAVSAPVQVEGADAAAVSYPEFLAELQRRQLGVP